jgi:hypothetical protein
MHTEKDSQSQEIIEIASLDAINNVKESMLDDDISKVNKRLPLKKRFIHLGDFIDDDKEEDDDDDDQNYENNLINKTLLNLNETANKLTVKPKSPQKMFTFLHEEFDQISIPPANDDKSQFYDELFNYFNSLISNELLYSNRLLRKSLISYLINNNNLTSRLNDSQRLSLKETFNDKLPELILIILWSSPNGLVQNESFATVFFKSLNILMILSKKK